MVELRQEVDGVGVYVDGALFTRYVSAGFPKVFLYPVLTPRGAGVTRRLDDPSAAGEHPHHRGLWSAHGSVNGVDFWEEYRPEHGRIVHREMVRCEGGDVGTLATRMEWVDADGKAVVREERVMRFSRAGNANVIELAGELRSADGGELVFGDTKEGGLAAIRVVPTMNASGAGTIWNAEGLSYSAKAGGAGGEATWGKRSRWVSYEGPTEKGPAASVTIEHVDGYLHPTYWHVRGYGLFAANPFGRSFFENALPGTDRDVSKSGSYTLPAGQILRNRYRVTVADVG